MKFVENSDIYLKSNAHRSHVPWSECHYASFFLTGQAIANVGHTNRGQVMAAIVRVMFHLLVSNELVLMYEGKLSRAPTIIPTINVMAE
jgi:hypothetical protein